MTIKNVQFGDLLKWDNYLGKKPSEAMQEIYLHANTVSESARKWYWASIKWKKRLSLGVRSLIFILLVCGAILPILAGLLADVDCRLRFTQFGVAALAVAGLLQIADRIFGWSSGWIRYITTVMAMDNSTLKFELDWASYMLDKADSIEENDKKPLFSLAKQLEDDITKMQSEETDKWVAEFNNSTAILTDLIKSHRETADKFFTEEKEKKKAQEPGSIELTLIHQSELKPIQISVDEEEEENFTGTIWTKVGLTPGIHQIRLSATDKNQFNMKKPIQIKAGSIEKLEIKLP